MIRLLTAYFLCGTIPLWETVVYKGEVSMSSDTAGVEVLDMGFACITVYPVGTCTSGRCVYEVSVGGQKVPVLFDGATYHDARISAWKWALALPSQITQSIYAASYTDADERAEWEGQVQYAKSGAFVPLGRSTQYVGEGMSVVVGGYYLPSKNGRVMHYHTCLELIRDGKSVASILSMDRHAGAAFALGYALGCWGRIIERDRETECKIWKEIHAYDKAKSESDALEKSMAEGVQEHTALWSKMADW